RLRDRVRPFSEPPPILEAVPPGQGEPRVRGVARCRAGVFASKQLDRLGVSGAPGLEQPFRLLFVGCERRGTAKGIGLHGRVYSLIQSSVIRVNGRTRV